MGTNDGYTALGLNSRGTAWGVAILGLLLTPALVGIPLLVWGCIADYMLNQHQKAVAAAARYAASQRRTAPPSSPPAAVQALEKLAGVQRQVNEQCENCGATIGKLETPRVWQDHVVCASCAEKLANSA